SLSLDKKTGSKCLMVAARKLGIMWGGTPTHWEWLSHPDAKVYTFPIPFHWLNLGESVGLISEEKLELECCQKEPAIALIILCRDMFPRELVPLKRSFNLVFVTLAVFRFVDSESDHEVETQAKVVHFLGRGPRVRLPLERGDG
ncbi:hypothetical protein H5410_022652, partial [Solanum commersonii]